jgi:hypothetical protein
MAEIPRRAGPARLIASVDRELASGSGGDGIDNGGCGFDRWRRVGQLAPERLCSRLGRVLDPYEFDWGISKPSEFALNS